MPSVAGFVSVTLDATGAVRGVELEVIRVLDCNHIAGRARCVPIMGVIKPWTEKHDGERGNAHAREMRPSRRNAHLVPPFKVTQVCML